MNFQLDFDMPHTLTQQIAWESDEENDKPVGAEDESNNVNETPNYAKSPIFHKRTTEKKIEKSPIINSKRKIKWNKEQNIENSSANRSLYTNYLGSVTSKQIDIKSESQVRETLKSIFLNCGESLSNSPGLSDASINIDPCEIEGIEDENSQMDKNESGIICRQRAEAQLTGSTWLAGIKEESLVGSFSSNPISSCESDGGLIFPAQHPVVPVSGQDMTVASLLTCLEYDKSQENYSPDSTETEWEETGRRRKPVRGGLLEQLERSLKWERFSRVLLAHQGAQMEDGRSLVVTKTVQCWEFFIIYGLDSRLIILKDLCTSVPSPGSQVSFYPPWCHYQLDGLTVYLGISQVNIVSSFDDQIAPIEEVPEATNQISLCCPCIQGNPCSAGPVTTSTTIISLLSPPGVSLVKSISTSNALPANTVTDILDRGDTGDRVQLTMTVHRVLQRLRSGDRTFLADQTLDTIGVTNSEVDISLLCEDSAGDFTLVKLSDNLRSDPGWQVGFGSSLEMWTCSRVRLTGLITVGERVTKGQCVDLFQLICSIRTTNRRFCYILRPGLGSGLELLETGVVKLNTKDNFAQVLTEKGRVNVSCIVLGRVGQILYLLDSRTGTHLKVLCKDSFLFPRRFSPLLPAQVMLAGLMVGDNSRLQLDRYSGILQVIPTEPVGLVTYVPGVSKSGDIVRLEGVVEQVDLQKSVQWVICQVCRTDLELRAQGGNWCPDCKESQEGEDCILLVCQVKGTKVILGAGARQFLPVGMTDKVNPREVIGKCVNSVVCIVGENGHLSELGHN